MGSLKDRATIRALTLLPRNWMSRAMGSAVSVQLPGPLQKRAVKIFGKTFGVNFDEVKAPLESFDSIQDFFTRELKEGARPICEDEDALVSPCDGAWGAAGDLDDGQLLQAKGRAYTAAELLVDEGMAARFHEGSFATLYLSPRDYHRFHTPAAGRIVRADAVPGTLWPVNNAGISLVDGLFVQNERVIAYLDVTGDGEADIAMVAVGATMVGKVKLSFSELETNEGSGYRIERYGEGGPEFERGQEWGRFCFGSTIILLMREELGRIEAQRPGEELVLGTKIGTLS